MDDTTVTFLKVFDTTSYNDDGTLRREKEYVFKIGKLGPFTERVPLLNFDPSEIERRVSTLRSHLVALPR